MKPQPMEHIDANKMAKDAGCTRVRVIRPGMRATADFDPKRLNIYVDALGGVEKVAKG